MSGHPTGFVAFQSCEKFEGTEGSPLTREGKSGWQLEVTGLSLFLEGASSSVTHVVNIRKKQQLDLECERPQKNGA